MLKVGVVPNTLLEWVKKAEVDSGLREGITTDEREQIKALERENRELRPASEMLAQAGIEPSVGSRGDSYDNALAETINGLYKAELIHRRTPWKTKESVELATLQWVHWFNHIRLLEPLGYIPPDEAEENYYRQLANSPKTAVSTETKWPPQNLGRFN